MGFGNLRSVDRELWKSLLGVTPFIVRCCPISVQFWVVGIFLYEFIDFFVFKRKFDRLVFLYRYNDWADELFIRTFV